MTKPVTPELNVNAAPCAAKVSPDRGRSSYGEILKSTAFIGGASAINLVLGIIRTKFMAVLLGPAGVGLAGVYTSIIGVAGTIAGMGLGNSGVRQVAEAVSSGDETRVARTIVTLRRTALVVGLIGALSLMLLSYPVALLTFGDSAYTKGIMTLGLAIMLSSIYSGHMALIQGLRRVADLARLNVLGSIAGTVLGLPLIAWLGERGIVPLLVVVPAGSLVCSYWFARKVPISPVAISWRDSAIEARGLLGLGFAFMASTLMAAGVAYLIRLLVVRQLGMAAAGQYSAAFTLSGIYAGFILQAMGTDFYPRLTAVAEDHPTVNRLVNEQTEVALLLAVPGVLATLVLAPWVIRVLYAPGFEPAAKVLEWQVLGILGRVVSLPMAFILLAKGRRVTFLWTEAAGSLAHAGFVWLGIKYCGLTGTGMAFAALYLFHALLMLNVSNRQTGFGWSADNLRLLAWTLPLVGVIFLLRSRLPTPWDLVLGISVTAVAGWICLRGLLRRVPPHRLAWLRKLPGLRQAGVDQTPSHGA